MDEMGEYFCQFPAIDLSRKYTYAIIYARYPNQRENLIVIGVIAISDRNKDQYVLQFFKDNEIRRFFKDQILDNFDNFSEEWLAQLSFKKFGEPFFVGTPFVVANNSAEKICRTIHEKYEQTGYIIKDDTAKYKLD
jgi:hypothetical protein